MPPRFSPSAPTRTALATILAFAFMGAASDAAAGSKKKQATPPPQKPPIETKLAKAKKQNPQKGCAAAILVDTKTGEVLFAQNPDKTIHPASVAKLATAMVIEDAINKGEIDPKTGISTPLYKTRHGGSSPHAYVCDADKADSVPHKTVTANVKETLQQVLVASFNAGARVLGTLAGGRLQSLPTKLGLADTHIVDPAGTSNASDCQKKNRNDGNISTVRDLARLAGNIPNYPLVRSALETAHVTIGGVSYKNKTLLAFDGNVIGKTGTVRLGTSFAGIATKDGQTLAVAVAECPHGGGHFKAVKELLAAHHRALIKLAMASPP